MGVALASPGGCRSGSRTLDIPSGPLWVGRTPCPSGCDSGQVSCACRRAVVATGCGHSCSRPNHPRRQSEPGWPQRWAAGCCPICVTCLSLGAGQPVVALARQRRGSPGGVRPRRNVCRCRGRHGSPCGGARDFCAGPNAGCPGSRSQPPSSSRQRFLPGCLHPHRIRNGGPHRPRGGAEPG